MRLTEILKRSLRRYDNAQLNSISNIPLIIFRFLIMSRYSSVSCVCLCSCFRPSVRLYVLYSCCGDLTCVFMCRW